MWNKPSGRRVKKVWNRAAEFDEEDESLLAGDRHLQGVLQLWSYASGGGLLDAIDSLESDELDLAQSGFEYLGLDRYASLLASTRDAHARLSGADDEEGLERLEEESNEAYEALSEDHEVDIEKSLIQKMADAPADFK